MIWLNVWLDTIIFNEEEYAFDYVVCKTSAIMFKPHYGNTLVHLIDDAVSEKSRTYSISTSNTYLGRVIIHNLVIQGSFHMLAMPIYKTRELEWQKYSGRLTYIK